MPRKPDVPQSVQDAIVDLRLRLRLNAHATAEEKIKWFKEFKANYGPRSAQLVLWLIESDVPTNQLTQYYIGNNKVDQNNNAGGISQKAGGDMIGVNAGGTQTVGDITIYKSMLDQSGAVITQPQKLSLIETREQLEACEASAAMKPILIEQFDKLTKELAKGDKKDSSLVTGLWNMVYGAVKAVPTAVSAVTALEKLKTMFCF